MKVLLFMQSRSDDRKLASEGSHWSASAKNFILTGQWKTEFSQRSFRTQSFGALCQPLRSWLISAVPSEQKSVFHRWPMKARLFIKLYCGWCHKAMRWLDFHNLPAAALPIRFNTWLL
jgi:hypothetical protein